jgi:hypothetical protein
MGERERQTRRRAPVAVLTASALGIVIAVAAALAGPLRFGGPRWLPGGLPTQKPVQNTRPPVSIPTQTPSSSTIGHLPNLTWVAIVIAVIAAAFVVFLVVRWLLRRRRDRAVGAPGELQGVTDLGILPDEPSVETSLTYLRRGLQRALDVLDSGRLPSDAIVEAWLGLQEAAEDAGFQRQSAETPTEFTTRILRQVDVDPAALATLRRLYLAVRFGDHTATPADVDDARAALRTLEKQWAVTP